MADPALAAADPARVDLRVVAMVTELAEDLPVAVARRGVLKDDQKGAHVAAIVVGPKVDLATVTATVTVDRIADLRVIAIVIVMKMIRSRFDSFDKTHRRAACVSWPVSPHLPIRLFMCRVTGPLTQAARRSQE